MYTKNNINKIFNKDKLIKKKNFFSIKNQFIRHILKYPHTIFNIIIIIIIMVIYLKNLYTNMTLDLEKYINNVEVNSKNVSIFKNIRETDIFINSNCHGNNLVFFRFIVFPKSSVINIKSEKNEFTDENSLLLKAIIHY